MENDIADSLSPLESNVDLESHEEHNYQPNIEHANMYPQCSGSVNELERSDQDMSTIETCSMSSCHSIKSEVLSDMSEDNDSSLDSSDLNDSSSSSESSMMSDQDEDSQDQENQLTEQESQALTRLSCLLRNNLSASACKDILETIKGTMKNLFPNSETLSFLDFGHILSYVDACAVKEVHYCVLCDKIFPENTDEFRCGTRSCNGLRYKGPQSSQLLRGRQPRQCFVIADTKEQLTNLLQTPGIWKDIERQKALAHENKGSGIISDITSGEAYQGMLCDEGFLSKYSHNLTGTFNTDGVNLYSSSKTELWPIFLAINELSPSLRFARDNMLLVGIWQGKGKPPFLQYMTVFSQAMNSLYSDGIELCLDDSTICVRLAVICGVADLPAKAGILNMSYFNEAEACITCEETGVVVRQGKGTARCYPYRSQDNTFVSRNHEGVLADMHKGTDNKRCKGFKGMSGLAILESYDLVKGSVPDYMHGVLLGITKTLLTKWFSPSQSRQKYFIGKHLKAISKRMSSIKPPKSIERLPRDLEKHYSHFKATELQAWLLYYAIPCLNGFLNEDYMSNLACFSEAVYILLGDTITESSLERANFLMNTFYASFQELYGSGSCGLNVHNAGVHLCKYVKFWGPMWAWSAFPFEDSNAVLLQSVHGTGIVLKQVMRYNQAQAYIRRKGLNPEKKFGWKITHKANNCDISGSIQSVSLNQLDHSVCQQIAHAGEVKKVCRIAVNNMKFHSSSYLRMQRRVCSVVVYGIDQIGTIKYFLLSVPENKVYAIINHYEKAIESSISNLQAGKHLVSVDISDSVHVVPADDLIDTLVYINTGQEESFVVRMPNRHGHAIFK